MRIFALSLVILGLLVLAPSAYATTPYAEFNPDNTQAIVVTAGISATEAFLPLNEFLSGFDIWTSTSGTPITTTFTLMSPAGATVGTRTVSIPAIADTDAGTRFHVDLPAQVSVSPAGLYRIVIETGASTLHLYEASATRLIAHNAAVPQAYSDGRAFIGSEEQSFSFAHALYESHESSPPALSHISTSQQVIDHAVLSFNANEPVDYRVQYNDNLIAMTGSYTSCVSGTQYCAISLPVSPATEYIYTLTARDVWGNITTATGTFTSLANGQAPTMTPTSSDTPDETTTPTPTPTPDTVPPIITNARVVSSTTDSVSVAWTTNEAANSIIVAQLTPELITVSGNTDGTLELEHFITTGNLTADTYYQVKITSSDDSNNTSIKTLTFLSPKNNPAPTPTPAVTKTPAVPSSTTTPGASSAPATPTTIPPSNPIAEWSAPASGEPSGGYRIDIFDRYNNLVETITVPAGVHASHLAGFNAKTGRVVVYASHNGVFEKVPEPVTITAPSKPFIERMLLNAPHILVGLTLIIILIISLLKFRKPKPPITPPPVTSLSDVS